MEAVLAPGLRAKRRCRCAEVTYKMVKNVKERNRNVGSVFSLILRETPKNVPDTFNSPLGHIPDAYY